MSDLMVHAETLGLQQLTDATWKSTAWDQRRLAERLANTQ